MFNILVSPLTVITIVVGIVISFFYLRSMWQVLQSVAKTLDNPDEGESDGFGHSFVGAIVAVVASSLAIISYGLAPQLLYVGIVLALASPIAVAYTFSRELDD
ncbi:MAG: hypothetical protein JOY96_00880 [Verrucomicrobia bacterium]|nr:hypothetical protein [Verrucomicrobiota bacterium]MBV9673649.1 hypothetical protein [Verrucomicrobiota bacterium]